MDDAVGGQNIMDQQSKVAEIAKRNYGKSTPWPEHDPWHAQTHAAIQRQVEQWLAKYASGGMQILNAGSGGTEYKTSGDIIHMDIVERYVSKFERRLVGSIENIPLPDASIDGIICVGSVINYTDAQQSIAEFSRTLRAGGFLILEYERNVQTVQSSFGHQNIRSTCFLNPTTTTAKHIYCGCTARTMCVRC